MRYVGITGFMSRGEVDTCLAALPEGLTLMCGVLASSKTLCGHANKYPKRYPKVDDIAAIFSDDPRCLNLVHVATDSTPSTVDGSLIPPAIDMLRGMRAGGVLCHGVQINCLRPPLKRDDLAHFGGTYPAARMVLQIGPRWLAAKLHKPFLSGAGGIASYATDILLDVSGGTGKALDPVRVAEMVRDLRRELDHWGLKCQIGIAGGFCAETLPAVASLVREYGLSIDAEGRLRDGDEGGALNLDKARAYLAAAGEVFR